MKLSNDLLSQFAKVTRVKKEKTERTFYGTIVEKDSKTYVRLDGSDALTPAYTTVKMINGERVTVMIKNHTAIVTGNISTPAARSDDVDTINKNWDAAARSATDYIHKDEEGAVVFEDATSEEDTDLRIDAKSLRFYIKSITALYKPYYELGDSINVDWHGSGYVSGGAVYFSVPLAKPVIGTPNVIVNSINGLTIRQNGAVNAVTQPTYSATLTCDGGIINVIATISSTATDAPCGVAASISIAFS